MSEIIKSIKRTPFQSLASFLILFFTLFLALFFFNITSFFYGMLAYVETKPQVTVYFQTTTSESDIFKIRDQISSSNKASDIKYISKNEALKVYRELNKDNPQLLEMVSADILPASLEIYAKKPEYLSEMADFLKKQSGVDEVEFQKSIVEKLLSVTDISRKISIFMFAFLIITSFVVLTATTAFKIALKKDEIELMQFLGATKNYIRKPFLLEGMFFGFTSATTAFIFYNIIFFINHSTLSSYLSGINNLNFFGLSNLGLYVWPPSIGFILLSYFITVLFGVLIGFIGNYFSTAKYIEQ